MFFILSVVNIPLYIKYSRSSGTNDFEIMSENFQYFMLGNIGATKNECSEYTLDYELSK